MLKLLINEEVLTNEEFLPLEMSVEDFLAEENAKFSYLRLMSAGNTNPAQSEGFDDRLVKNKHSDSPPSNFPWAPPLTLARPACIWPSLPFGKPHESNC